MNRHPLTPASRRQFLKTSAPFVAGAALAPRFGGAGFAANSETLRVGLIGCGGRGTAAATNALAADKHAVLTAMADAFPDRMEKSLANLKKAKTGATSHQTFSQDQIQVKPDQCFSGFDGYLKLLQVVDVVLMATPPGFRPLHLKAAIAAGKHVFCEKPMAVDAPGVRSVLETAAEAKRKGLSLVSGFGSRRTNAYRAVMEQIHGGALGELRTLHSTYHTGPLWHFARQSGWTDMEWQMRDWYYFTWLSGDHLVEQAVHNIDRMAWVMGDVPPAQAVAHGGRQVRIEPEFGHIFDHFSVVYEWANGVKGFLFTRQQAGCSMGVWDEIFGTRGVYVSRPEHEIRGEKNWSYTGPKNSGYQTEHDEFLASIRSGQPINDGVWMANSTLMAILGRMAAYTGQTITWDQAMNSQENLTPAKYDWDLPLPLPPVATPGKTKFV